MDTPLVIHGKLIHKAFVSDEPIPDVEGRAELIVYPASEAAAAPAGSSVSDFFGKAPQLRSAEDIDAQLEEERNSWDDQ
jgi:hypothetical protein